MLGHSARPGLFHPGGQQAGILAKIRGRLPRLREVLILRGLGRFHRGGRPRPGRGATAARRRPGFSAAQVLYTSGTTGRPKGAVLTHRGLTNNARIAFETAGIGPGDVEINPMPMFHVGGCALFTLGPVQATVTQVLMPRFSPALELELIEAYRVTVLCGVPTMLVGLLEAQAARPRDLTSVRMTVSGGAMVPPELVRRVREAFGCGFETVYGQTECSPVVTQTAGGRWAGGPVRDGRPGAAADRDLDPRPGHERACWRRPGRRDLRARLLRDARLQRQPRRNRRGDRRRGLAAHRRSRDDGRARLSAGRPAG